MAYVNTPGGQINGVVPDANEDPNIAYDLLNIAKAIEKHLMGVYATSAARNSAATAMGPIEGMFAFTQDDNKVWYYDGAAWQEFPPRQVKIASGGTVPTNADPAYINGDVYFKT